VGLTGSALGLSEGLVGGGMVWACRFGALRKVEWIVKTSSVQLNPRV